MHFRFAFQSYLLTLQAVSNPKLVGTSLLFKSPSIVFGHPITLVFMSLPLETECENYHSTSEKVSFFFTFCNISEKVHIHLFNGRSLLE